MPSMNRGSRGVGKGSSLRFGASSPMPAARSGESGDQK